MARPLNPMTGLLVAALGVACNAAMAASAALPDWMAGTWCANANTQRIEEVWLAPAGGLMLGMSRSVAANQKGPQFEFLRVELRDGVPTYLAQPQGAPPVAFKLTQSTDSSARFENPQHDFPQRIEYRRTGHALRAEIAGPRQGKERVIAFDYQLCPPEPKRP
jgi:hypothetical protein